MLGIIGAMEVEVEKLRAKMTETEMKTVAGISARENWRERTLSSFAPVSVR